MDTVDIKDRDYQTILICAVRYCIGRRTYMPGLVTDYIRPQISKLDTQTLHVMARDIKEKEEFPGWGDPGIDVPVWKNFLCSITEELKKRGEKTDNL